MTGDGISLGDKERRQTLYDQMVATFITSSPMEVRCNVCGFTYDVICTSCKGGVVALMVKHVHRKHKARLFEWVNLMKEDTYDQD